MEQKIERIHQLAHFIEQQTADIDTMSRSKRLDIQRMIDDMQELLDDIAAQQLAADRAAP